MTERERITVHETPLRVPSLYAVDEGEAHIWLNNSISGWPRLYNAWHETGHHFLHVPQEIGSIVYFRRPDTPANKIEREADAFALLALLPLDVVHRLQRSEGDSELRCFLPARWQLWKDYHI